MLWVNVIGIPGTDHPGGDAAIRRCFFSAQTAGQAHHLIGNIWRFSGKAGKQHRPYLGVLLKMVSNP